MPGRLLPRLGWPPRNAAALAELGHVVLSDVPLRGRHNEHVADRADSLPGSRLSQIVVAIPARLLRRVGNELKDQVSACRYLAAGTHDARNLIVHGHTDIEARREINPTHSHAAVGAERPTVVLLKPHGEVSGLDIDANVIDDVNLVWSVRHPERLRVDLVRAMRQPSRGTWSKPHTVVNSGGDGNGPIGAPQVETNGDGRALVAWSTAPNEAGHVDLDSAIVRPVRPSSAIRRLATDVDPGVRSLAFGIRVNDLGQAAVTFRHLTPCPADPGTMCHTVSALRGRLRDPGGAVHQRDGAVRERRDGAVEQRRRHRAGGREWVDQHRDPHEPVTTGSHL
jgi:hypothetical protein